MTFAKWGFAVALLPLAACDPGTPTATDIRVSGNVAVGMSVGDGYVTVGRGGNGPPPGRTAAEREARRDYYRGPRGHEF